MLFILIFKVVCCNREVCYKVIYVYNYNFLCVMELYLERGKMFLKNLVFDKKKNIGI